MIRRVIKQGSSSFPISSRSNVTSYGNFVIVNSLQSQCQGQWLSCSRSNFQPQWDESRSRLRLICQSRGSTEDEEEFKDGRHRRGFGAGTQSLLAFSVAFLGFFETQPKLTLEEELLLTIKKAILAIQRGQFDKAEKFLFSALKTSHDEGLEDAKTQIFDIQANLALQLGQFDKAEHLFKLTAQRLVSLKQVSPKDNSIVEMSLKLAGIYTSTGHINEAISGFEYCINTQKEKIEKEGVEDEDSLMLAAWALHGLSQLYIMLGTSGKFDKANIDKALALGKEAHQFVCRAVGEDSEQSITIQSDLASALALIGDFEGALTKLNEAENLTRETNEDLFPHLRVNTGTIYIMKGEFEEAEKACKEARILASKLENKECQTRAEECIRHCLEAKKKSNHSAQSAAG